MRFQYKVVCVRLVNRPIYGPSATKVSIRKTYFPYGKGETLKTGKEAKEAAFRFANSELDECNTVAVWRETTKGNVIGDGDFLKSDTAPRFDTDFNEDVFQKSIKNHYI